MPQWKSLNGCSIPDDYTSRMEALTKGSFFRGLDPHSAALREMHRVKGLEEHDPFNEPWSKKKQQDMILKRENEIRASIIEAKTLAEKEALERKTRAETLVKKAIAEEMITKENQMIKSMEVV